MTTGGQGKRAVFTRTELFDFAQGRLPAMRERKRGAFTLIELLVVMAIIMILANLLIPAIRTARDRAFDASCKSSLHQWGVAFALYHQDHGGNFESADRLSGHWPFTVRDYYDDKRFLFCPVATKSRPAGFPYPGSPHRGATFLAWDTSKSPAEGWGPLANLSGSFGKNGWVANPATDNWYFGADPDENAWQSNFLVERTDVVPILLDSAWLHTLPLHSDSPPPFADDMSTPGFGDNMKFHCIDRHDGSINAVFLDGSARSVGLKELWILKWHPLFNTENRRTKAGGVSPGDWPEWMRNFDNF